MDALIGLLFVAMIGSITIVGLAVLVTIIARHRGQWVEHTSEEAEPPASITENPYQPSRLRVTVKRSIRPYSPAELKVVVGGSLFVGLAFLAMILIGLLIGG